MSHIFTHWKTTLGGALLAALQIVIAGANWKQLAIAAATAALGAVAKDPK